MNFIFSPSDAGWPEFPRVSYARLDQTEPLDPGTAPEAVFAFDAVDASWPELNPSGQLDLGDAQHLRVQQQGFWKRMFGPPAGRPVLDPYDRAPIYRIEITSRPGDLFFDTLIGFKEDDWVRIELAPQGTFEVDVYGGLFAAAVLAHLTSITLETDRAAALSVAFDMDTWPDAAEASIRSSLSGLSKLEYLVAFDVGQGSANGLVDAAETPRLFFDLGCGVYGNQKTRPIPLRFCWRADPPVVLSHWDTDHWAGEISDPAAQPRTWIAPRQKIGPTHTAFATRILAQGGTLHVWGNAPSSISLSIAGGQRLTLVKCTGATRNGSGISCLVEDGSAPRAWLLTGDAGYHQLGLVLPADLSAVVVPHHGADMGATSVPPLRPAAYTRLLYSFGPGNTHGRTKVQHPTAAAIGAHSVRGWNHNAWSSRGPGMTLAGGDVLATATHSAAHLDGAVASWLSAPAVPFTSIPCLATLAVPVGCTAPVTQS